MMTDPGEKQAAVTRGNQKVATNFTLICMGTTSLLVGFAIFGPKEGMEALGIIIPWGIAILTHMVLSLPALLLAWKANHPWCNVWIYGYFLIFWGFHAVYYIQVNEIDDAFMRKVHGITRPVDTYLYQLLTHKIPRTSASPLGPKINNSRGSRPLQKRCFGCRIIGWCIPPKPVAFARSVVIR